MMAGTLLADMLTYAWQASAARALGEERFAPVASVWTIMFLIVTILLAPVEQYAIRTVAWARRAARSSRTRCRGSACSPSPRRRWWRVLCWLLRDSLFDGVAGYVPVCAAIVLSLGASSR